MRYIEYDVNITCKNETKPLQISYFRCNSGLLGPSRQLPHSTPDRHSRIAPGAEVKLVGPLERATKQIYPGEHAAIVDSDLWERANAAVHYVATGAAVAPTRPFDRTSPECRRGVPASQSAPRISHLLALALQMEQMIQDGTVKKYSDLAHLGQVSAARITQIMNLLYLAPDIQEQILSADTPQAGLRESADEGNFFRIAGAGYRRRREADAF